MEIKFTIPNSRLDTLLLSMDCPAQDLVHLADVEVSNIVWYYLWAICKAHHHFRPDDSNCIVDSLTTEAQAHRMVDRMLSHICRNEDWHTDLSDSKFSITSCSTDVFDVNGIFAATRKADHVIPKRRQPAVRDIGIVLRCDALVGEAKLKAFGDKYVDHLNHPDREQLAHYLNYLRQGRTQCVFHWIAQYIQSNGKQRWNATTVRLYCKDQKVLCSCMQQLDKLNLHLIVNAVQ